MKLIDQPSSDVRVLQSEDFSFLHSQLTDALDRISLKEKDINHLDSYSHIYYLDLKSSLASNKQRLIENYKEIEGGDIEKKLIDVCFLEWKLNSPEEKKGAFESFSDPSLLSLLGLNNIISAESKYFVDSHKKPINSELVNWECRNPLMK